MVDQSIGTKLYQAGFSTREVGSILGIDRKTVIRHLRKQGVELRASNNVKRSTWLVRQLS